MAVLEKMSEDICNHSSLYLIFRCRSKSAPVLTFRYGSRNFWQFRMYTTVSWDTHGSSQRNLFVFCNTTASSLADAQDPFEISIVLFVTSILSSFLYILLPSCLCPATVSRSGKTDTHRKHRSRCCTTSNPRFARSTISASSKCIESRSKDRGTSISSSTFLQPRCKDNRFVRGR